MTRTCRLVNRIENLHNLNAVLCGGDTFRTAKNTVNEVVDFTAEETVEGEARIVIKAKVNEISVLVGEYLNLRIKLSACLCAEELNVALAVFDVEREACFYGEHETVVKSDKSGCKVLYVADVVSACRNRGIALTRFNFGTVE